MTDEALAVLVKIGNVMCNTHRGIDCTRNLEQVVTANGTVELMFGDEFMTEFVACLSHKMDESIFFRNLSAR